MKDRRSPLSTLVSLVAAAGFALVACGGEDGDTSAPPQARSQLRA